MEQMKIIIANIEPMAFTNKETGEVTDMLRLHYLIDVEETEEFIGCAYLKGYTKAKNLPILKACLKKEVTATIQTKPTEDGMKYIITSINNQKIR